MFAVILTSPSSKAFENVYLQNECTSKKETAKNKTQRVNLLVKKKSFSEKEATQNHVVGLIHLVAHSKRDHHRD